MPADPHGERRQLTTRDVRAIRELRYLDGLTSRATARQLGIGQDTVLRYAPGWPGKIPNDRVRELFLTSGVSITDVARTLGWTYRCPLYGERLDGYRVKRTLGIVPDKGRLRSMIDVETAGLIAEACGFEAWQAMPDDQIAA